MRAVQLERFRSRCIGWLGWSRPPLRGCCASCAFLRLLVGIRERRCGPPSRRFASAPRRDRPIDPSGFNAAADVHATVNSSVNTPLAESLTDRVRLHGLGVETYLVWSRTKLGGRFANRQPESLTPDEWRSVVGIVGDA